MKSLNIVLFGEPGVGKSSLVNLIAGREVAVTSPSCQSCTLTYSPYSFEVHGISYTIWDTMGIEQEPTNVEANGLLSTVGQAYKLIQELTDSGGVDLLLFYIPGRHITAKAKSNYKLFYELLCGSKVPIALTITFLEPYGRMEEWWEKSVENLERYGIKIVGHACVTKLPRHSKSLDSKRAIENLLGGHDDSGRYNMPQEQWVAQFCRRLARHCGSPLDDLSRCDLECFLRERCKLGARDARTVAGTLTEGRESDVRPRRKIFGLF